MYFRSEGADGFIETGVLAVAQPGEHQRHHGESARNEAPVETSNSSFGICSLESAHWITEEPCFGAVLDLNSSYLEGMRKKDSTKRNQSRRGREQDVSSIERSKSSQHDTISKQSRCKTKSEQPNGAYLLNLFPIAWHVAVRRDCLSVDLQNIQGTLN